jgi:NAD(P)-dependent dehydrogenase (short-subunit alcohol dehydrogenase family)
MKIKTALIVGGTDGIGKQMAILLGGKGYNVLVIGRNAEKLQAVKKLLGNNSVTYKADLSLLAETRRVGEEIASQHESIDLIIHTADVLVTKRIETIEGHEVAFATNYLSRFLLNALLVESLQQSVNARIIHVAAAGMFGLSKKNFPPVGKSESGFTGHNVGQASNDYYGLEWKERYPSIGINILNPGMVDTGIRRQGKGGQLLKMMIGIMEFLSKPVLTSVNEYANIVLDIALGRNQAAQTNVLIDRKGKPLQPRKDRLDKSLREYVWKVSEDLVKPSQSAKEIFVSSSTLG